MTSLTQKQRNDPRRRGLLAKVHIAPKELGIPEEDVREQILKPQFGKTSRGDLTIMELQFLVEYFESKGWKPKGSGQRSGISGQEEKKRFRDPKLQIEILRERAEELAGEIENGSRRLRGLLKKFCGVEDLEWVWDTAKLKRVLAVLEEIKRSDE